tara:strand:+ start:610 stop:1110 length:501 start_codon:yes stop_codon:yes gene_type:complete
MDSVNNIFKNIKNHDIILGIILIIYIFGGYKTPVELTPIITNLMAYIIMIIIFILSLCQSNIIISILLGLALLILVQRSLENHPKNIMPSQSYRDTVMANLNKNNTFKTTTPNHNIIPDQLMHSSNNNLEESIIANIDTIKYTLDSPETITFKPTLSKSENAHKLQ